MKTALQTIGIGALLSVTVLCIALVRLVDDVDRFTRLNLPKVESTLDEVALATENVTAATKTLAEASAAEKDNWTKASKEAAKTGGAVRLFVDKLDRQLNDKTLPNFDAQISALSAQSQTTLKEVAETADALSLAATNFGNAATSLDKTIADPNIGLSLAHLSLATGQLADASGHANKILDDGEKVADHYEAEILKPVSFARKLGEYVLTFGADARVLFTGGK